MPSSRTKPRPHPHPLPLWLAVSLVAAPLAAQAPPLVPDADAQDSPPTELIVEAAAASARVELADGLRVAHGEHSVTFRLLGQARYVNTHDDGVRTSGFQFSLLRPSVRGRFFGGLVGVFVQTELAGANARLLDAEISLTLHDALTISVGQFITPASRAFMTPIPVLLFPDFSVVSVAFREGRDVGGLLHGSFLGGRLAYYASLVNGNGINVPANDGAGLTLVSRVEIMPLGSVRYDNTQTLSGDAAPLFSVAAASHVDLVANGDAVVGGDATVVAGPFMLLTEAYTGWQQQRTVRRRGAYAQVGITLVPDRLQLGLRASVLDPNSDMGNDALRVLEGLVAVYALGNRAKVTLRYAFSDVGSASMADQPAHSAVIQMQGWL